MTIEKRNELEAREVGKSQQAAEATRQRLEAWWKKHEELWQPTRQQPKEDK